MAHPRLPAELVHEVLHYLRPGDDWTCSWPHIAELKRDLCSCALVCHAWQDISRSHLFHDISYSYMARSVPERVDDSPPTYVVRGWTNGDPAFPYKSLGMLYAFFSNRPDVAACVRQLRLQAWPGGIQNTDAELAIEEGVGLIWEPSDCLNPDYLLALLNLCSNLRDLSLSDVFVNAPSPSHLVGSLPTLSSLAISTERDDISHPHVLALLSCFSFVREAVVSLDGIEDAEHEYAPAITEPLHFAAQSLKLHFRPEDEFIACLRSSKTIHTLTELDIAGLAPKIFPFREVHGLFEDTASTLHCLRVEIAFTDTPYDGPLIDISRCKNLQHLTVASYNASFNRYCAWDDILPLLPPLYTGPAAQALRTIRIELLMHQSIKEREFEHLREALEIVDHGLSQLAKRGSFTQLQIVLMPEPSWPARKVDLPSWRTVCKAFPKLAAAGMLTCHVFGSL